MRSSHGSQVTTCPGINNVTRPRVLWASSDGHFMLLPHPWRREHMKHWWGRPWSMRQPHGHLTPRLRSRRSNRCRDPRLASSKLTTDGPLASHQWLMPWSGTRSPLDTSSTTPPYSTRSTSLMKIAFSDVVVPAYTRTRHLHQMKYQIIGSTGLTYKNAFFVRMIPVWNLLPEGAVSAATMPAFQRVAHPVLRRM